MTGLIILKHLRNVSDETVVDQFKENAYYYNALPAASYLTCGISTIIGTTFWLDDVEKEIEF